MRLYCAVADKQGVPRRETDRDDPKRLFLKICRAAAHGSSRLRPSMRLIADTILFSAQQTPRFNAISIAGAHVRDAGATAVEELAYTLANGPGLRRGATAPRRGKSHVWRGDCRSSFTCIWTFFEEIAKFRAGRSCGRSCSNRDSASRILRLRKFRFGVVCGGIIAGCGATVEQYRACRNRDFGGRARRCTIAIYLRI